MISNDLLWTLAAFTITILVFTYLLGDHFLFRLVSYISIGAAAGTTVVFIIHQVIMPRLIDPLLLGAPAQKAVTSVPLALSLLLLARLSPRLSRLGVLPMAFLVGVGAAVLIGGAVMGTLFQQSRAALNDLTPQAAGAPGMFIGWLLFIGAVSTLFYFQFTTRKTEGDTGNRSVVFEILSQIGKVFIAVTLGAIFADILAASVTALVERLEFLRTTVFLFMNKY
jgi:hypothetical protein